MRKSSKKMNRLGNQYERNKSNEIDQFQRDIIANIIRDGELEVSSEFQEDLISGFSLNVYDAKGRLKDKDTSPKVLNIIGDAICKGKDYGFFNNEESDLYYDWSLEVG